MKDVGLICSRHSTNNVYALSEMSKGVKDQEFAHCPGVCVMLLAVLPSGESHKAYSTYLRRTFVCWPYVLVLHGGLSCDGGIISGLKVRIRVRRLEKCTLKK